MAAAANGELMSACIVGYVALGNMDVSMVFIIYVAITLCQDSCPHFCDVSLQYHPLLFNVLYILVSYVTQIGWSDQLPVAAYDSTTASTEHYTRLCPYFQDPHMSTTNDTYDV